MEQNKIIVDFHPDDYWLVLGADWYVWFFAWVKVIHLAIFPRYDNKEAWDIKDLTYKGVWTDYTTRILFYLFIFGRTEHTFSSRRNVI